MEDLSGRQFGSYRIIESLGEGGMAAVYKAYQPSVDRYIALKILPRHYATDPQFLGRFRHEGKIVAQLQHPHILSVFDFGQSDGYTFLAMPFVHSGTLANLLTGKPISLPVALRVATQVCEALDYAHGKGIVHRDIKPSNILMDERGNCLVGDFGVARMAEGATRLTMTGALMGTPAYMSPEQAAGKGVGPASDIYSFGIVLYEMLTGRPPFEADTPIALAIKHLHEQVPSPRTLNPELTPEIEAVVLKALARAPEERFASGQSLVDAFRRAVETSSLTETVVQPRPRADAEPALEILRPRTPASYTIPDPAPTQRGLAPEFTYRQRPAIRLMLAARALLPHRLFGRTDEMLHRKRRLALFLALAVGAVSVAGLWVRGSRTPTAVDKLIPELNAIVNDFAHVININDQEKIAAVCRELNTATGDVLVVATVPRYTPYKDIRWYAAKLFENHGRGIGQSDKNNGLLVVVAIAERRVQIEVGYGLQSVVTDKFAEDTATNQIAPHLQRGDYGGGLLSGVIWLANKLAESSGVSARWSASTSPPGVQSGPLSSPTSRLPEPTRPGTPATPRGGLTPSRGESVAAPKPRPIAASSFTPNVGKPNSTQLPVGGVVGGLAEAPPPPPPAAPVRVGGAIKSPNRIKNANPAYPPIAQSARVQGVVIIEATIGVNGKVTNAKVLRSIPLLDAAAVEAVKQWEYTPTILNGQPVEVIMTVTVNFTLQ